MTVTYEMQCPKCGDHENINITAEVTVTLLLDDRDGLVCGNEDSYPDHSWGSKSCAYCGVEGCDFDGTAGDFFTSNQTTKGDK